jgi:hypothetical protein
LIYREIFMNYFEHNARSMPRVIAKPITGPWDGSLFMSRDEVAERRKEAARLHKRGQVNEMPYYLYSTRARRAGVKA